MPQSPSGPSAPVAPGAGQEDVTSVTPPAAPHHGGSVTSTDVMLVCMALIWGVNVSVIKIGTQLLDPFAYNGVRVVLAAATLLLIAAIRARPWPPRRTIGVLLGLGLLGNGLYQLLFISGVARTRAGSAALVLAATPAFIALIGWLRGVERTTRRGLAGIALSLLGIAAIVFGGAGGERDVGSARGNVLVLLACICWALFTVLLKPHTHRTDAIQVAGLTMAGGAILLVAAGTPAIVATAWPGVGWGAWGAIAFSGLGGLVIAYLFYYRGLRLLGPTRTAMYGNLQPIIALLFAWLTLGEVPTIWQGVGVGGIMTGLLLTRT